MSTKISATPYVRMPVKGMQVGDLIVSKYTRDGEKAVAYDEVKKLEPSRKREWYRVNDSMIFYPGGYYDTPVGV